MSGEGTAPDAPPREIPTHYEPVESVFALEGFTLGYCHRCSRPAAVGIFVVGDWRHRFFLCGTCLAFFADAVSRSGP